MRAAPLCVADSRLCLRPASSRPLPLPPTPAETKSRSRERRLFPKTDVTILRLLLPHERLFSSLVFATVAHSAPSSIGISRRRKELFELALLPMIFRVLSHSSLRGRSQGGRQ